MALDPQTLSQLSRNELASMARQAGVPGAGTLTRTELADELLQRTVPDTDRRRRLRGWFGTARDMLASLVERGLNLPDAAALIRGDAPSGEVRWQPPLATITLAKIYDAQGYRKRALAVLDDLLKREPEHPIALLMKSQWAPSIPAVAPTPEPAPKPGSKIETATFVTTGPTSARVTWDLDEDRFAALGGVYSGQLTLTIAAFCPLSDGTRVSQQTIDLHGASGEIEIDALPAGAALRSHLSWQFAGRVQILLVPAHREDVASSGASSGATEAATAPNAPNAKVPESRPAAPSSTGQPASAQAL